MKDATAARPGANALAAVGSSTPAGAEGEVTRLLPAGHPAWQRDLVAVSARVRGVLATLRPIVVHVLGFWDHVRRAIPIGSRRLEIDPSGSYRFV